MNPPGSIVIALLGPYSIFVRWPSPRIKDHWRRPNVDPIHQRIHIQRNIDKDLEIVTIRVQTILEGADLHESHDAGS